MPDMVVQIIAAAIVVVFAAIVVTTLFCTIHSLAFLEFIIHMKLFFFILLSTVNTFYTIDLPSFLRTVQKEG